MKVISFEFGSIVLGILLLLFIFWQHERIKYLEDTIYIQNDAIEKQQVMLQLYKYQLYSPYGN